MIFLEHLQFSAESSPASFSEDVFPHGGGFGPRLGLLRLRLRLPKFRRRLLELGTPRGRLARALVRHHHRAHRAGRSRPVRVRGPRRDSHAVLVRLESLPERLHLAPQRRDLPGAAFPSPGRRQGILEPREVHLIVADLAFDDGAEPFVLRPGGVESAGVPFGAALRLLGALSPLGALLPGGLGGEGCLGDHSATRRLHL